MRTEGFRLILPSPFTLYGLSPFILKAGGLGKVVPIHLRGPLFLLHSFAKGSGRSKPVCWWGVGRALSPVTSNSVARAVSECSTKWGFTDHMSLGRVHLKLNRCIYCWILLLFS